MPALLRHGGIVDDEEGTREALAIDVDQGIGGEQVVAPMTRITSIRGAPKIVRVNNGPEFISKALDRWA